MLVKQKEKTMKFNRVWETSLEENKDYLLWEREDNDNVIITKMKGEKIYQVENLETGVSERLLSLRTAKEFGQIL